MNTPITFEIAKLLKEKRFDERSEPYRYNSYGELTLLEGINAPAIADVIMWLYKKHGIWVQASISRYGIFYCNILKKENIRSLDNPISWETQAQLNDFNSPTEAYEAAIEYVLNNLIKKQNAEND